MIRKNAFASLRRPLLAALALTLTVSAAAWAEPPGGEDARGRGAPP
jgi:hypothetical protein